MAQRPLHKPASAGKLAAASKRLFLIDAMSYIFRAYHAPIGQEFTSPKGVPTKAVFLFNNMLRKLIRREDPDYVAVVFESAGPTVRDQLFKQYKAQRPPMPDDLKVQLPYIRRLCQAFRLAILEYEGYEADDVIGTLARRAADQNLEAVVVTSDKDMLQLVQTHNDRRGGPVRVFNPTKELFYDEAEVEKYFGVPPEKVVEVVALMGDAIDNIPGARDPNEKLAPGERRKAGIGEVGAKQLIQQFGSLEEALKRADEVKRSNYREALKKYPQFARLSRELATLHTDLPVPLELEHLARQPPDSQQLVALYSELGFTSLLKEQLSAGPVVAATVDYRELETASELEEFLEQEPGHPIALWCESVGEPPLGLEPLALAFSSRPAVAVRISLGPDHRGSLLPVAARFLEEAASSKVVHDAKTTALGLERLGIQLRGVTHDIALSSYLLEPTTPKHSLEDVVVRRLHLSLSGREAEKADFIVRLHEPLWTDLETMQLTRVYEQIEAPLSEVLAAMERAGIRIDPQALGEMSKAFEAEIQSICRHVWELAGTEFNLNSPKQLGEILFEKLQLPLPRKYGKGKVVSTAADVLEELSGLHELPARVLAYRELAKLKSTYIDLLPRMIRPPTGRLHTSFHQTGTATGRLSSSDPNLQNIPIRTELGNRIRAAFVAEPGWRLLGADYSQIELRVLAHLSEDSVLIEAFQRGEDIHARTAQEVLGVPPLLQTVEHRRVAKMINFGILYGLTAYGLATRLGIEPAQAQSYIDAYFRRYAGVKTFRERLLGEVRRTALTRTLFGRIRPIPEINARHAGARNLAERTALNSPLQGTAADLIKLAMIRIHHRLAEANLRARLLLQVHDELLLEVPEAELTPVQELVRSAMEQVYPLSVPLSVKQAVGNNWAALKE